MSGTRTIYRVASAAQTYTKLGNALLKNREISLECKGLLVSILTLPPDWQFNMTWMQRQFGIGRDKAYRLMEEASRAGYLVRTQERTGGGTYAPVEYVFGDDIEELKKYAESKGIQASKPESDFQEAVETVTIATDSPVGTEGACGQPNSAEPKPENQYPVPIQRKDSYKELTLTPPTSEREATPSSSSSPKSRKRQADLLEAPPSDKREAEILGQREDEDAAFAAYRALQRRVPKACPASNLSPERRGELRQILSWEGEWPTADGGTRTGPLGLEGFLVAIARAERSPFLRGETEHGYQLKFEDFVNRKEMTKILEGQRDKWGGKEKSPGLAGKEPPHPSVLARITREQWANNLRRWDEKGRTVWPIPAWGYPPGHADCAVPHDVLSKYMQAEAA